MQSTGWVGGWVTNWMLGNPHRCGLPGLILHAEVASSNLVASTRKTLEIQWFPVFFFFLDFYNTDFLATF